jgi:hypothetical protein
MTVPLRPLGHMETVSLEYEPGPRGHGISSQSGSIVGENGIKLYVTANFA